MHKTGETRIETKDHLKYPGTYQAHANEENREFCNNKASKRLMSAEMWSERIRKVTYASKMARVQRQGSLRIFCAYCKSQKRQL